MHTFTEQAKKIYTNVCLTARKLIATAFVDRKVVFMVKFLQQWATMKS
jgi:hypothetical protein